MRLQANSERCRKCQTENESCIFVLSSNLIEFKLCTVVTCTDSLSKVVLQGTLEEGRRRGRHRKCWMDNIKKLTTWTTELLTMASCRKVWKRISAESSVMSPDDLISQGTKLNYMQGQNLCTHAQTESKHVQNAFCELHTRVINLKNLTSKLPF